MDGTCTIYQTTRRYVPQQRHFNTNEKGDIIFHAIPFNVASCLLIKF